MIQVFCDVCEELIEDNYQEFEIPMLTIKEGEDKDIPIIISQIVQLCPVCAIKYTIQTRFAFESFTIREMESKGIEDQGEEI